MVELELQAVLGHRGHLLFELAERLSTIAIHFSARHDKHTFAEGLWVFRSCEPLNSYKYMYTNSLAGSLHQADCSLEPLSLADTHKVANHTPKITSTSYTLSTTLGLGRQVFPYHWHRGIDSVITHPAVERLSCALHRGGTVLGMMRCVQYAA